MGTNNTIIRHSLRTVAAAAVAVLAGLNAQAGYETTVLADNPLAFYPLNLSVDNAGTATDASGNGNSAPYYNVYLADGPTPYITNSGAFSADVQSYVDLGAVANTAILQFTGPITLEAWVQPSDSSHFGDIIAKGYDGSTYQEVVLRENGSGNGNNYYGSFGTAGVSGGTQDTNWYYLVMANDGSTTKLYVNGVMVQSTGDTTGVISFGLPWAIGNGTGAGYGRFFNGNIAEVAIYNHGLTGSQVLNHFYSGKLNASPESSPPIVVTPPAPQSTYYGGSATFRFTAVSATGTTNQWLKDGNPIPGQTGATLTINNAQAGDIATYGVIVGNSNGTTTNAGSVLTLFTPAQLEWAASGNSGTWDVGSSANWLNLGNSQQTVFNPGDQVLFDDKAGEPTSVNTSGSLNPSLLTVDSSTNSFTLGGSGTLTGTGSLVKRGSSLLTILCSGNFTGSALVAGGTVYAGNNAFRNVASITVTNNATVDLGGGSFNDSKPVYISGPGVNNQGAIINTYNDYPNESLAITMKADATIGGSARWDLASSASISGPHTLTIDWSADTSNPYGEWNAPTIGADVVAITAINGSKIGAKYCDNSFLNPSTMVTMGANGQLIFWNGGWNGSIHLLGNGTVYLWSSPSPINGTSVILEENAQWLSSGGGSADEPVNSAVTLNGIAHIQLGDHNMVYTNVISGPGGFVWEMWNHSMVFAASNTYAGPTIIGSAGFNPQVALTGNGSISHSSLIFFGGNDSTVSHIDATGRPDQTLTLASGQTLSGIGAVTGALTVSAGATVAPAGTNTSLGITTGTNVTGAIAASGAITLNGTTTLKLNGSGVSDAVQSAVGIAFGGTLNLVNVSGAPLAAGNTFQVFSASGNTGAFGGISPPTPGAGLLWDTTQLSAGILGVKAGAQPTVNSIQISGGNIVFSGTNGPSSGSYVLLTSTDIAAPLHTWTPVVTNNFDASGNFSATNAINGGTPQRFYSLKVQ